MEKKIKAAVVATGFVVHHVSNMAITNSQEQNVRSRMDISS